MGYQFSENKKQVNLDIANYKFCIIYNVELLQTLKRVGNAAIEYANSNAFEQDTEEDMAYFVYDLIDQVLGDGAADSIFEGREPDYFEAADVFQYIINEINNAGKNRKQRQANANVRSKKNHKHYNGNHA